MFVLKLKVIVVDSIHTEETLRQNGGFFFQGFFASRNS